MGKKENVLLVWGLYLFVFSVIYVAGNYFNVSSTGNHEKPITHVVEK